MGACPASLQPRPVEPRLDGTRGPGHIQ